MSPAQKVIKYFAFAFAVFLMVTILSSILLAVTSIGDSNYLFASEENYIDFTKEFEDVRNIDITNYSGDIYVQTGNVDKVIVDAKNVPDSYTAEMSSQNTLEVKDRKNRNFIFNLWFFENNEEETKITITLPQNCRYGKAEFDNGSGSMELSGFNTDSFQLDGGSGSIIVSNIGSDKIKINTGSGGIAIENVKFSDGNIKTGSGSVNITNSDLSQINFNTGSGSLNFEGSLIGECEIDGGSGGLAFELTDNIKDYELRLDAGSGGIWVNGDELDKKDIRNEEAINRLEIDGGSGEVTINFAEE